MRSGDPHIKQLFADILQTPTDFGFGAGGFQHFRNFQVVQWHLKIPEIRKPSKDTFRSLFGDNMRTVCVGPSCHFLPSREWAQVYIQSTRAQQVQVHSVVMGN